MENKLQKINKENNKLANQFFIKKLLLKNYY
jgi:hypothetical protein